MRSFRALLCGLSLAACACGDSSDLVQDAGHGVVDGGDATVGPVSIAHCDYVTQPANANATGALAAGALTAGVAEHALDLPLGSAMGGHSNRAGALGTEGLADTRKIEYTDTFVPSYGIQTRPRVKALALTAGSETVVIVKADLIMADDNVTASVASRLGPEYAGKVLFATSHSHAQLAQYSTNPVMAVGLGKFRQQSFDTLVDALEAVAREALAARAPAQISIAHDDNFDADDLVSHDRRDLNDALMGGPRKDHDLYMIRVDREDDTPLAMLPIFGVHGTVLGAANNYASTDAIGAIERALEEQFESPVLVMHLQGAGGDVSPGGSASVDCALEGRICYNFPRLESVALAALAPIYGLWERAGESLASETTLEMITRVVPLGPDWRTFSIRAGALSYAPWDGRRVADRNVLSDAGDLLSPIDEFNAPYGAPFCGQPTVSIAPGGQMPGTTSLEGYGSCSRVENLAPLVSTLLNLDVGMTPICGSTRTTLSALRLGDHVIATLPGEPVTLLADRLRAASSVAPGKTIIVGYAQGHVGYLLTPEDWVLGGYEPSINLWGPLEGEYLAERSLELVALASNQVREDAMAAGVPLHAPRADTDMLPAIDPAPTRGTIPSVVPSEIYARQAGLILAAQPASTIERFATASFVWLGEDPREGTPVVRLERETAPSSGVFEPVLRRSGREINDGELLLSETPQPLIRSGTEARTHYWAVEWQAVPAVGEGLSPAAAVLGRYRFAIEGHDYTLTSDPFEVTAATLVGAAARVAANVQLSVGVDVPHGYRLIHDVGSSNGRVPLRDATVDVVFIDAELAETLREDVVLDSEGRALLTEIPSDAVSVRITDQHGNQGQWAIE